MFQNFNLKRKMSIFWENIFRNSRVNYLLHFNQSQWNQVSLYILKKICLSMQVFGHDQSVWKTCAELCLVSMVRTLCMTDRDICLRQWISNGLHLLIFNFLLIQFMQVNHCLIIAGGSLMGPFIQFVGLEKINAYCTMATRNSMRLSSSQSLLQMV